MCCLLLLCKHGASEASDGIKSVTLTTATLLTTILVACIILEEVNKMKNYQVTIAGEESFYLLLSDAEYKAVLLFITACNNRNIVEIKISPVE